MDSSNFVHFLVSFFIPLGWGIIFYPIRTRLFRNSFSLLIWILIISFVSICGKELLDSSPSVNDLVSDFLGFFFGVAFLFSTFQWKSKRIDRAAEQTIENQTISLRTTLRFIERIERKSGDFYSSYAKSLKDHRAAATCELLARDSYSRANRVYYLLSGWKRKEEPLGLLEIMERDFLGEENFSLALREDFSAVQVMELALQFEKRKLQALSKFRAAFQDEWKQFHFARVLNELEGQVEKLQAYLTQSRKAKSSTE